MSKATKRIPVSEERWREPNGLKEPGQIIGELIETVVEAHEKAQLVSDVNRRREEGEFGPLDETYTNGDNRLNIS